MSCQMLIRVRQATDFSCIVNIIVQNICSLIKRLNQKKRQFSQMSVFSDNLKSTRVIFTCYFTIISLLWLAIPHIVCYFKLNYSIRKNITERGLTKMKNSATILSLSQSRVTLPASFVNTFLKISIGATRSLEAGLSSLFPSSKASADRSPFVIPLG